MATSSGVWFSSFRLMLAACKQKALVAWQQQLWNSASRETQRTALSSAFCSLLSSSSRINAAISLCFIIVSGTWPVCPLSLCSGGKGVAAARRRRRHCARAAPYLRMNNEAARGGWRNIYCSFAPHVPGAAAARWISNTVIQRSGTSIFIHSLGIAWRRSALVWAA